MSRSKFVFFIFLAALISIGAFIFKGENKKPIASAAIDTSDQLRGWAWSSNIGWISFNCSNLGTCAKVNYKATLETTGEIRGWAWSSNAGWIKMDPNGAYPGAPAHSAKFDPATGRLSGWMRACALTDNPDSSCSGGGGGWIKMTDGPGSNVGGKLGTGGTKGRIVSISNPSKGGWAWENSQDNGIGIAFGWISFFGSNYNTSGPKYGVIVPTVDCEIIATPNPITPPQVSVLSWSCNQYVFPGNVCDIDNGIGIKPSSGTHEVRPNIDTTYNLTCQGLGGPDESSVTLGVEGLGDPGGPSDIRIIETPPR